MRVNRPEEPVCFGGNGMDRSATRMNLDHSETDPFLWTPESEMWRINRERCGLLFGPAAAILQVAHPRIAQGVFDPITGT